MRTLLLSVLLGTCATTDPCDDYPYVDGGGDHEYTNNLDSESAVMDDGAFNLYGLIDDGVTLHLIIDEGTLVEDKTYDIGTDPGEHEAYLDTLLSGGDTEGTFRAISGNVKLTNVGNNVEGELNVVFRDEGDPACEVTVSTSKFSVNNPDD